MPFQVAGSISAQPGGSLVLHIGLDRFIIHRRELRNLLFLGNRVGILHLRQQATIHGETREERILSGWASPSLTGRAILFEIGGPFVRKFSVPRRDVEQVVKGSARSAPLSLIIQGDIANTGIAEI